MFALRSFCAAGSTLVVQVVDAFASSVAFLLNGNTAGSGTVVDSGPNAYAGTLRTGSTGALAIQGSFSPFGLGVGGSLLMTGANPTHTTSLSGTGNGYVTTSTASWLGTGDFTVECFFYQMSSGVQYLVTEATSVGSTNWSLYYDTASSVGLSFGTGSTVLLNAGVAAITLNRWSHVAVMQIGSTMAMFLNGVKVASAAAMTTLTDVSNLCVGASNNNGQGPFDGYITNVRIVKGGTQPYGSTMPNSITVPTAPLTSTGSNTMILLKFENAAVVDSAGRANLQPSGSLTTSTSQAKYGGASLFFNNSTQWASAPYSQIKAIGSGDFTIDGWLYQNSASTLYPFGMSFNSFNYSTDPCIYTGGGVAWQSASAAKNVGSSAAATGGTGVWYHFAVCRYNGTTYFYANGVLGTLPGSVVDPTNYTAYDIVTIGAMLINGAASYQWSGYMDDFRITYAARYPGGTTFTPPTFGAPYPTTALGFSELYLDFETGAAADGGVRKGTSSALTLVNNSVTFSTVAGRTGTQATFTGSGSYLSQSAAANANLYIAYQVDFTMEAWVYMTTLPSAAGVAYSVIMLSKGTANSYATDHTLNLIINTSNMPALNYSTGAASASTVTSTIPVAVSAWTHVAVTYDAFTKMATFWLNGAYAGASSMSTYAPPLSSQAQVAQRVTIGRQDPIITTGQLNFAGSMDNVRIAKGTQLYKAPFMGPLLSYLTPGQTGTYSPTTDGTTYLTVSYTTALDQSGDFTYEGWVYFKAMPTTGYQNIFGNGNVNNTVGCYVANAASNTWSAPYKFKVNQAGVGDQITGTTTIVINTWYHFAVVRQSNAIKMYVNGTQEGSTWTYSTNTAFTSAQSLLIGQSTNAYFSNVKYTKGTAVYTANFTPA